nr:MAG TPA: hypothetical protein [Caudoviricetes sp.]
MRVLVAWREPSPALQKPWPNNGGNNGSVEIFTEP